MLAVVALGSALYYRAAVAPTEQMLHLPGGELAWLREEFVLNDAQFAAVAKEHETYAPICQEMCARIAEANAKADHLIRTSRAVTPEVRTALEETAAVREECRAAMLTHIYAVAAQMNSEQGSRYVEMMKARILEPGTSSTMAAATGREGKE